MYLLLRCRSTTTASELSTWDEAHGVKLIQVKHVDVQLRKGICISHDLGVWKLRTAGGRATEEESV